MLGTFNGTIDTTDGFFDVWAVAPAAENLRARVDAARQFFCNGGDAEVARNFRAATKTNSCACDVQLN